MSELTVFTEAGEELERRADPAAIAAVLSRIGAHFERWPLDESEVRAEALKVQGYTTIDTVSIRPDDPDRERKRQMFLSEHRHAEDEVRFFSAGQGLFTLRDDGRVYAIRCEAGDMISVPAGMRHWFDMGERPSFTAMRFFRTPDGWFGDFTGDPIAERFPRLEAA